VFFAGAFPKIPDKLCIVPQLMLSSQQLEDNIEIIGVDSIQSFYGGFKRLKNRNVFPSA
jgi:hypothetical protein